MIASKPHTRPLNQHLCQVPCPHPPTTLHHLLLPFLGNPTHIGKLVILLNRHLQGSGPGTVLGTPASTVSVSPQDTPPAQGGDRSAHSWMSPLKMGEGDVQGYRAGIRWGRDSKLGIPAPEFFPVCELELNRGNLGKRLSGFLSVMPQGQLPAPPPTHVHDD